MKPNKLSDMKYETVQYFGNSHENDMLMALPENFTNRNCLDWYCLQ